MPNSSARRVCIALVSLAFAATASCYPYLPDPMPTHWNLAGKADGFTPKPLGPFVLPLVLALVQLVFVVLRRRFRTQAGENAAQERALDLIQLSVVAFLFVATAATLLAALGFAVPFNRVLTVAVGLLVIVLGGAMSKLARNGLVGIRTPWTLASDQVWEQTHKLGARLFVIAGLVALIGGFAGIDLLPILIALGTAAVAPAVYSFRLYRKLEGLKPPSR